VSVEIDLLADPADAELAGLPGSGGADVLIALGDAGIRDRRPAVRWLDRPRRSDETQEGLVIAPAGVGLWRRAPWPAADALFDLPPAGAGAALLVGSKSGLRDAVAERAAARNVPLGCTERLDASALAGAGCIVLAEAPGGALPARSFAVLAAGRLLIVPRLTTAFGLEDGLDHLEYADPDEAVTAVESFSADPGTFARLLLWGRLKAEQQRSSVVYARLAEDLRLQGLAGGV